MMERTRTMEKRTKMVATKRIKNPLLIPSLGFREQIAQECSSLRTSRQVAPSRAGMASVWCQSNVE